MSLDLPSLTDHEKDPPHGSIIDFLSDGSLAALVEELGDVLDVRLELHDGDHRKIAYRSGAEPRWAVDEHAEAVPACAWCTPIIAHDRTIGWLVACAGDPGPRPTRILTYLSQIAGELCTIERGLRHHVREVELMYRLSSLIIAAAEPDEVLATALGLVLDAMGLDAGSVVLLSEDSPSAIGGDEQGILTKASRGLSAGWIGDPSPLSRGRQFDRLAIAGEVIAIEDLASDDRVLDPDRLSREGLVSFISAGLAFRGRPIGVYRLYSRSPRHFTADDRALLQSVAEHSAIAIEQSRLLKIQEAEAEVSRQLQLAEDVQRRMLPVSMPEVAHLDLAARYRPSDRLAGDFYDVFESHDKVALAVGDVVGHGVAAALMMAGVRSTLRAIADDDRSLSETVTRANRAMCRDTLQSEFCTLFYGRIDPDTLDLSYCNAGHEPPLLIRRDGSVERLQPGGMLVGVEPEATFEESSTRLEAGDALVVFTDGLVEAMSFSGERFGIDRLVRGVRAGLEEAEPTSAGVVERVLWELRQFAGLRERADDVTILVARIEP